MGAGSSKAESKPPPKSKKQPPERPVANVNKQESKSNDVSAKPDKPLNLETNLHLSGPIAPIQPNKVIEREYENEKKAKSSRTAPNPTTLQFENDSDTDVDDDIDAVLKIPMSMEPSQHGRNKNKKNRKDNKENIDNGQMDNDYNSNHYNKGHVDDISQRNDSLPETYAQRLQRQQYKLQQDMLIREKTSIRNLRNWQDDDEDEDDNVIILKEF